MYLGGINFTFVCVLNYWKFTVMPLGFLLLKIHNRLLLHFGHVKKIYHILSIISLFVHFYSIRLKLMRNIWLKFVLKSRNHYRRIVKFFLLVLYNRTNMTLHAGTISNRTNRRQFLINRWRSNAFQPTINGIDIRQLLIDNR